MHDHEEQHRRHCEEVHVARAFVIAHDEAQRLKLHGFPDHESRQNQDHGDNYRSQVGGTLRGVVETQILVGELAAQRLPDVAEYRAGRNRQELAAEVSGENPVCDLNDAVDGEEPHGGEVPLQGAGEPAAQRPFGGKLETEERRSVIDPPP